MNIALVFRADFVDGEPVPCYPWSYADALSKMGHTVFTCGEGHPCSDPDGFPGIDFVLEIENGRNEKGELRFRHLERRFRKPNAVLLIDSHGHPELHRAAAEHYQHVFFAVWSRRDLFAKHRSAHWCPNATDLKWFDGNKYSHVKPQFDVGFFGSKKGLSRAADLTAICKKNGWTYDIRQVGGPLNPNRWPATAEAMANCRVLFNRGQKHDGPNQRVMESMAMGRPLLSDYDGLDGMSRLFDAEVDYMPYEDTAELESFLAKAIENQAPVPSIARNARIVVESKHLVINRARKIMGVIRS